MSETLYTSTSIVLFGRLVEDLAVVTKGRSTSGVSKKDGQFARIYGFSYEGAYFEVPTPVLFMVDGNGAKAESVAVPGPNPRDKKFVADLKAWTVSRTDETVRMDIAQGKYEELLLDVTTDGVAGVSGARVSGARVSGARVSGARVSGARVSGARVSGARVSGARGDASD